MESSRASSHFERGEFEISFAALLRGEGEERISFISLEFALLLFLYFLQIRLLCPFHESQKEPAKIFNVAKTEMKGKRNFTQLFCIKKGHGKNPTGQCYTFPIQRKKRRTGLLFLPFSPFHKLFYPPPCFSGIWASRFFGGHVHCSTKKRRTKNRKRAPLASGRRGLMGLFKKNRNICLCFLSSFIV